MKHCTRFAITACIAFFYTLSYAQTKLETTALNRIILNNDDTLIQFYTIRSDKKIQPEKQKDYHWYKADTILVTQNGYDGKLLHGSYRAFYPNKNLMAAGNFRLGTRHGTWKSWHSNGRLKNITRWKNGVATGKMEEYNEAGNLVRQGNLANGLFTGYEVAYKSDTIASRTRFRNGQPVVRKNKQSTPQNETRQ